MDIDDKPLTIWGGLIEEILHLEGGRQKVDGDPILQPLYDKLRSIEETKTVDELSQVLSTLTDREVNYLNSPFLDHLRTAMKSKDITYSCAANGFVDAFKFLRARGPKIHDPNMELKVACENGHLEFAQYALEEGANVDFDEGKPLRFASVYGHTNIVIMLIDKYGADVHANYDMALQMASNVGRTETVRALLDRGAVIEAENNAALHMACENGHTDTVLLLLDRGAAHDDYALELAGSNGHTDTVRHLLDRGADVHVKDNIILSRACEYGHLDTVRLLLDRGVDVHIDNELALWTATMNGHFEIVRLLLNRGATVFEYMITQAREKRHREIIKLLKRHWDGND